MVRFPSIGLAGLDLDCLQTHTFLGEEPVSKTGTTSLGVSLPKFRDFHGVLGLDQFSGKQQVLVLIWPTHSGSERVSVTFQGFG